MKNYLLTAALLLLVVQCFDVGYNVTTVSSYEPLKRSGRSVLYQVNADGVNDGRPLKLIELVGSHYKVGYDYAVLLGDEMVYTYKTFMKDALPNRWELLAMEIFLDWQFNSYVSKQMHPEFVEELLGMRDGGYATGNYAIHRYVKRTLVISSYPGDVSNDITYVLLSEFIRAFTPKKPSEAVLKEMLVNQTEDFVVWYSEFMQRKKIQCSFSAVWGNRTVDGRVYTMRNLDWDANTGINMNKMVFVYKVDGEIAHATLGFPGILGALTGMSAAGITVHEAGLDSHKVTQLGDQWTLRLRYIMSKAKNLEEAEQIWRDTNNTLGMNHMIGSGAVEDQKKPALVMQTMAGYTAFFRDHDKREDGTTFVDPKTKKKYVAGFSMPDVAYRTNHGYDPTIRSHMIEPTPEEHSSTMLRYFLLRDGWKWYQANRRLNESDALNMTAIPADKGNDRSPVCQSENVVKGINVISVMFSPVNLKMWAAFEYSFGKTFRPACCSVYIAFDMKYWFKA